MEGLLQLLSKFARFWAERDATAKRLVCMGIPHESDSVAQSLSQRAIQRIGRATSARLSAEVSQQRGSIYLLALRVDIETGRVLQRAEGRLAWDSRPKVLMGNVSRLYLEGLGVGNAF